jgi:hypothetical protein
MRSSIVLFAAVLAAPASAAADPDTAAPTLLSQAGTPLLRLDMPKLPPVSLRLEAARVAAEQFGASWRYPEPGNLIALDGSAWFVGGGYYRPRSARSTALYGGSIATTMLGEILLSAGSPAAGVGALLTGATLDAAAADSDRDAESRHPR